MSASLIGWSFLVGARQRWLIQLHTHAPRFARELLIDSQSVNRNSINFQEDSFWQAPERDGRRGWQDVPLTRAVEWL